MRAPIFIKVFGSFAVIIISLILLVSFTSFRLLKRTYNETLTTQLGQLGQALVHSLGPLSADTTQPALKELAVRFGRELKVRITVIDSLGKVLADSDNDPGAMENHLTRPEILQAFRQRQQASATRYSQTRRQEMLYVATPVPAPDGTIPVVVRVSLYEQNIDQVMYRWRLQLLVSALVLLAAALVGALLFTRMFLRPIALLRQATTRVAAGDFSQRVTLRSRDELNDLAISFNHMTDELRTLVEELSRRKNELNGIIGSLREGLLVFDQDDTVLLTNPSLQKILGQNSLTGRHFWEIIREPALAELVKKVRESGRDTEGEVALGGRTFACSLTRLLPRHEIIAVFHDITERQKLEIQKKNFITNVSHELRTPLTAIKGFTETLEEGLDPERRHYVEVIKRHTERLISLVQDILQLAQLEQAPRLTVTEKVDLKALVENVAQIFKPRLAEKNLTFFVEAPAGLPRVAGDAFKLEQLFINLIDNAVKYTDQGRVSVTLAPRDRQVEITVTDTGIGIAPEHADRIFERFYVVDKSRSRLTGGTGLGLSIVKHIVLLHQGSVEVVSTPGQGTVFTVRLPAV